MGQDVSCRPRAHPFTSAQAPAGVHGVFGAGTGILRTIDLASCEEVDAQLVADYVNEAVSRLDYFKAHERDQIGDRIKQWLAEVGS